MPRKRTKYLCGGCGKGEPKNKNLFDAAEDEFGLGGRLVYFCGKRECGKVAGAMIRANMEKNAKKKKAKAN
jgi:hypothetical protein